MDQLGKITTPLSTDVTSQIVGLTRKNKITRITILLEEGPAKIAVRYDDYHVAEGSEEKFNLKKGQYTISPNPNGLVEVAPMIENPADPEGDMIADPDAELFDITLDKFYGWMNSELGQQIAASCLAEFQTING